jgi:RNA polymerase sigma factor (sigma-70 family)
MTETTPFADDPPADLLDWISKGDKLERTLASKELVQRYQGWLFGVLKRRLPQYDKDFLADFVVQSFTAVFRRPDLFKRITGEDPVIQERRFKKWILVIANNRYNSWNRKQAPVTTMDDESLSIRAERFAQTDAPRVEEPSSQRVDAVSMVMEELTERERDILYAYLSNCPDVANRQSKLPRDVIAELCVRYETTPENIRTIRSRTLKKVRAHLEKKGIKQ